MEESMSYARQMLDTHPRTPVLDREALVECVEACFDCAQACTDCADACLGEEDIPSLVRCIRLNLDCADLCEVTGRLLSCQTELVVDTARSLLQACADACRVCGAECERHAEHMEHCRVCAEACRRCEEACNRVLSTAAA